MSGIELMRSLERIMNKNIGREKRLKNIMSIRTFEPTIIEPNLKMILRVLAELAKRVEAGDVEELEFFGVLLIQVARLLELLPKHIKKVFDFIKLIMKNYPKVLSGFGLASVLVAFKHFFSKEYELVFDDDAKLIIKDTISDGAKNLRKRALDTLFIALWNVPWAVNEYLDIIKIIMVNPEDPLYDVMFDYLSLIGRKNFYAVRPIVNAILEKYEKPLEIPDAVLRFFSNLTIPIRELEYLDRINKILEEVVIKHKNIDIRSMALINIANNIKHPKFVKEKNRLLEIIRTVTSIEEDIRLVIASLRAISTCIWRGIEPPTELIENLISYYDRIEDEQTKITFIDVLLLVYSNIPQTAGAIIKFAVQTIGREKGNIEVLWKLQGMLSTIATSEVNTAVLHFLAQKILELMKLPEEEFSVSLRIMLLENVIMAIAKREPKIIIDLADEFIEAYEKAPGVSVFDDIAKIVHETLRRATDKPENSIKLLNLLFNPPEMEATYESILKYLISLGKKYSTEIAKNVKFIVDVFRTIKELEVTITDPREKYFAVDEATKNLARLILIIMPSIPTDLYDSYARVLAAMYAAQRGETIRDVLYTIIRSKEIPDLYENIVNYLTKVTLSETHISLLQKVGILK